MTEEEYTLLPCFRCVSPEPDSEGCVPVYYDSEWFAPFVVKVDINGVKRYSPYYLEVPRGATVFHAPLTDTYDFRHRQ